MILKQALIFIPKHNGLSEEEQKKLEELRKNYIARKIAEAKKIK